jgi:hypothetical protein
MQLVSFCMLMECCSCWGVFDAEMRFGSFDQWGVCGEGRGCYCCCVCSDTCACRNGESPVSVACAACHSDCVAALVRAGAPAPDH